MPAALGAPPPTTGPACAGALQPHLDTSGSNWRAKLRGLKGETPLDDLPAVDEAPPDAVTLKAEAFAAQARTEAECLDGIAVQRTEVKTSLARRIETERRLTHVDPPPVKTLAPADETKLHQMEADMAKRFSEKVAAPVRNVKPSRSGEQTEAGCYELARANELYDKGDFVAALASYELAAQVDHVHAYAQLNRGNAFKAIRCSAEAATCYQQVLDAAPPGSAEGRLLHSYALCNLGTIREDERKTQQALQYYAQALALNPKCHLAAKDRANMHLRHAARLIDAGALAAAPAQHEMARNLYTRCLDVDWQLPVIFRAREILVRLETRAIRENEVYHTSINLTNVGGGASFL